MSYTFEIIAVLLCCSFCFIVFAECEFCNICESETPTKPDSELQISVVTSPIQEERSPHIEI